MASAKLSSFERVLLVLVLSISLFLRLAALDVFTTSDEALWHERSREFSEALATGEWEETYQKGHPGVVTMWLGTIALRLEWLQQPLPVADDWVRRLMHLAAPTPGVGIPPLTLGARRLVALVTWLGIVALFALLRRLFGVRVALAATILASLDPFFLAHSRFHHLDALLATFTMVSVASLLVYELRGRRIGYLLLSAAIGALAIANKSPGVLLVPWTAAVLLLPALRTPAPKRQREILHSIVALAIWGLGAAVVFVAIWPSMWVRPGWTLLQVFSVARRYAEEPHASGSFFWGAAVADPGPFFYPVVWAFRSTPWIWLGLAAAPLAIRGRRRRDPLLLIVLYGLLFAGAMTVGEKKMDRYLLPAFPLLDVVAAVGWVGLARCLFGRVPSVWRRWVPGALLAGVALAQFVLVWPTHPYYTCYYNPLVGAGRAAVRVLPVGSGEGLEEVAAYLNGKPHAEDLVVCAWRESEFRSFFLGQTLTFASDSCLAQPDYYVFYQNMLQREYFSDISSQFLGVREPEYVATVNGVDYAWVYANTLYDKAERQILDYILARADPRLDAIVVDGNAYLARAYSGPVALHEFIVPEREDALRTALQSIAAGRRRLWYVSYPGDACSSGEAKGLLSEKAVVADDFTVDGVRAVCYELPTDPQFVLGRPSNPAGVRFGPVRLVGYDLSQTELAAGDSLRLRLYWQAIEPAGISYTVFAQLFGPGEIMYSQADGLPESGIRPTSTWQPGEVILDDHVFKVPRDVPVGEYRILLGLYDAETMQRLDAVSAAGQHLPDDAEVIRGLRLPAP